MHYEKPVVIFFSKGVKSKIPIQEQKNEAFQEITFLGVRRIKK
jgi:hypothetical protein